MIRIETNNAFFRDSRNLGSMDMAVMAVAMEMRMVQGISGCEICVKVGN